MKIIKQGNPIIPQTLRFTCHQCGCMFEEIETNLRIAKHYIRGGFDDEPVYTAHEASATCPNRGCNTELFQPFVRRYRNGQDPGSTGKIE